MPTKGSPAKGSPAKGKRTTRSTSKAKDAHTSNETNESNESNENNNNNNNNENNNNNNNNNKNNNNNDDMETHNTNEPKKYSNSRTADRDAERLCSALEQYCKTYNELETEPTTKKHKPQDESPKEGPSEPRTPSDNAEILKLEKAKIEDYPQLLYSAAHEYGFPPHILLRIAKLVGDSPLEFRVREKLLRSMVPRSTVNSDTIIELLGPFSTYTVDLKLRLLKWLVMVLNVAHKETMHKMYGVFLSFLKTDLLLNYSCQLLVNLTEKRDVTPYRIRVLTSLYENTTHKRQHHLGSLLAVYKDLAPEKIVLPTEVTKIGLRIPEPGWYASMKKIQKAFNELDDLSEESEINVQSHKRITKQRDAIIPPPFYFNMESKDIKWLASQIGSEFSISQMAALLHPKSQILRHYVALQPGHAAMRINNWLKAVLSDDFLSLSMDKQVTLLQGIEELSHFYRENIAVLEDFLMHMLKMWDGYTHQKYILKLITRIAPCPYENLYTKFLQSISKLFFLVDVVTKGRIFGSLIGLLKHWLSLDWATAIDPARDFGVFAPKPALDVDHYRTIYEYIKYLEQLSALALIAENDHPIIQHHVVSLWELVSTMHRKYQFPFIVMLPNEVAWRLQLSSNPIAVDKVTGIVAQYAQEVDALKNSANTSYPMHLSFNKGVEKEKVAILNSYRWNFSQGLWYCRLLEEPQSKSLGYPLGLDAQLLENLRDLKISNQLPDLPSSISITHHVAFASLAYKYLRTYLRDYSISLNPEILAGEAKVEFVDFMRLKGYEGIYEFLYSAIGALKKRREGAAKDIAKDV